ncbi:hypothetical protein MKX01_028696 [Papaver californicum]|nr:hypothetical protein MKX01_028696 [Papaver californicum]
MEVLTRYDVSPHFNYGGTSRKTSTEVLTNTNTNCHGVYSSLDIIETQASRFPDDIVIEILSRLHVKPLMQFKSLCKRWLFLIKQDKQLSDLHFIRSKSPPNLLYINPLQEKGVLHTSLDFSFSVSKTLQQNVSCAEIVESSGCEEDAIISKHRITDDKWFPYSEILEPVNGLVCFVDWKTYSIRVYNASTREATPLVKSTLLAEENDKHEQHRHSSLERPDYESWEAFTVGRDTKWRKINAVPNEKQSNKYYLRFSKSVTITFAETKGSNKEYYCDQWGNTNPDDPDVIVAFDVGSEKYRLIPIPSFILDEPRDESFRLPIDMLVLGGHVGLLYRMEPQVVKLWMLDDGAGKKVENCGGNKSNWSSETITLPFCCDKGVGGSGIAGRLTSFTFLYSYDRKKKTWKKLQMDGVSSFTRYSRRSLVTTFTESLFPVQPLNKTKVSDI